MIRGGSMDHKSRHQAPAPSLKQNTQTLKGILRLDPLEPYGKLYMDDIGVIMGLHKGIQSLDPPRGLGILAFLCHLLLLHVGLAEA